MPHAYHAIVFGDAAKARQRAAGSRAAYARAEAAPLSGDRLGPAEADFIAARDSVYVATVTADGWPYVQHRGGPAGFMRVFDARMLGFADFAGNRQYVTLGNLDGDPRVALFFMDYAARRRLKMMGRMRATRDAKTLARLATPGHRGRVERGFVIDVAAFDWNCPQHITPRFDAAALEAATAPLRARVAALEAALRKADGGEAITL